jgi:hypothetical protein
MEKKTARKINPGITAKTSIFLMQNAVSNPATQAFRIAARPLHGCNTPPGCLYRKLAATKGKITANKAVARKPARLFYILVTRKQEYAPSLYQKKQLDRERREIAKMKKMDEKLGFELNKKTAYYE